MCGGDGVEGGGGRCGRGCEIEKKDEKEDIRNTKSKA
jgi:hypothetical protein